MRALAKRDEREKCERSEKCEWVVADDDVAVYVCAITERVSAQK
jgi:hypothetical protein